MGGGGWRRTGWRWRSGRYGGRLALLAGDLNTLDPNVDHTARLAGLPTLYRRRHLRRDGRTVDTRAVSRLLDAGLVDLWRYAGGGEPDGGGDREATVPTRHGGAEFAPMRLDYLLATPELAALTDAVRVVRGGDADNASDHWPVLADLALPPA
nr:hypothetical protein [Micromonospora eburnea]